MRGVVALLAALATLCTGVLPAASAAPDRPTHPTQQARQAGGGVTETSGDPRTIGAKIYRGSAFDACKAPSLSAMRAWKKSSPFGAVGVYFGGRGRACSQKNLSGDWMRGVHRMGWRVLPLYVGSQSPCVGAKNKQDVRMSKKHPVAQGAREGRDAVRRAKALGMRANSALYLDMEAYKWKKAGCAKTTLRFVQGWNRTVRKLGYLPTFYSSADSGVRHMEQARKQGRPNLPRAMWFARWHTKPSLNNERALDRSGWQPHRRIHQYQGNVQKSYGGHKLQIDRNKVDAPVAIM